MTKVQEDAACALLTRNWQQGTQIEALPPDLRPSDRAGAYRIQACLETYSPHPLFGWKIAATSTAGQAHIGVDGPLAGRLLQERGVPDAGACPLGNNLMRVAELEFAFRMAVDVPPRDRPWTQDEVMAQVESLHPAIELPDSRFEMFEKAGMAQLIADNACAHRFVIGHAAAIDWRKLDLAAHQVRALRDGMEAAQGVGANVLGDPRIALTWLVNELSRHGLTLGAGQTVITGTCITPLPIAAGDHIAGDFGPLGQVSVNITA